VPSSRGPEEPINTPIYVDGGDIMPEVNAVLKRWNVFGSILSVNGRLHGKRITDVVNIGLEVRILDPSWSPRPYGPAETPIKPISSQ
jgi:glucose-6-phosphate isomerase